MPNPWFCLRNPHDQEPIRNDVPEEREPLKTQSLTPNAIQLDWKNPVEFPCCPQQVTDNPLETYMANLVEGKVFCRNNSGESTVIKS